MAPREAATGRRGPLRLVTGRRSSLVLASARALAEGGA
jgi:hypothetical protein